MRLQMALFSGMAALCVLPLSAVEDVDVSKLPPAASKDVDFAKDIKPMLERSCVGCHGPTKQKSKYRMDTRAAAIKGGSNDEPGFVEGKGEKSPMVLYSADLVADMEMPPLDNRDKYPALSKDEVGLLRKWIDSGAKWPEGVSLEVKP